MRSVPQTSLVLSDTSFVTNSGSSLYILTRVSICSGVNLGSSSSTNVSWFHSILISFFRNSLNSASLWNTTGFSDFSLPIPTSCAASSLSALAYKSSHVTCVCDATGFTPSFTPTPS